MQNALLGLLTVVAFGEKLIRDNAASKYSQSQICNSLGKRSDGSAALWPVYLIFTFYNSQLGMTSLEMSHHTHTFKETGNFSKTFDDWNTATQCLNLFTSIWRSYLKVCFNFLLYLMLISNIYQNSYKGDKRHFHFQYWPLKQRNLNMTFFFCYESVFHNFTVLK